jgi:hypothetical protein
VRAKSSNPYALIGRGSVFPAFDQLAAIILYHPPKNGAFRRHPHPRIARNDTLKCFILCVDVILDGKLYIVGANFGRREKLRTLTLSLYFFDLL